MVRTLVNRSVTQSRKETTHSPARVVTLVYQTLVQPVRTLVPELDRARHHAEARPVGRPRHVAAGESRLDVVHTLLEHRVARKRFALTRSPRSDAAHARAGCKVCIRLGVADLFDRTLDAHLPLQHLPMEAQCGPRVRKQLASLSALVVG